MSEASQEELQGQEGFDSLREQLRTKRASVAESLGLDPSSSWEAIAQAVRDLEEQEMESGTSEETQ